MPYYKTEEVKAAAQGKWLEVLCTLRPELVDAAERAPRAVKCPYHGGKSDFRFFKDVADTGGGLCNSASCIGTHNNGFALLMAITGNDFQTVRDEVGKLVGAQECLTKEEIEEGRKAAAAARKAAKAKRSVSAPAPASDSSATHSPVTQAVSGADQGWRRDFPSFGSLAMEDTSPDVSAQAPVFAPEELSAMLADCSPAMEPEVVPADDQWSDDWESAEPPVAEVSNVVPFQAQEPKRETESASPAPSLPGLSPELQQRLEQKAEQLRTQRVASAEKAEARIDQVWNACVPLLGAGSGPAREYLKSRGLVLKWDKVLAQDSIRFHPALEYWGEGEDDAPELKGKYPAIVCAIRGLDGDIKTLHRTYLTMTGKKKLSAHGDARKMMTAPGTSEEGSSVTGASIQLGEIKDGVLGVAEGLETALSAYRATGIPCWSAVNATLLERIQIPDGVRKVIIWADKDRSHTGEIVANNLTKRLEAEGVIVETRLPAVPIPPREKGIDWNDILMKYGILGFPRR